MYPGKAQQHPQGVSRRDEGKMNPNKDLAGQHQNSLHLGSTQNRTDEEEVVTETSVCAQ